MSQLTEQLRQSFQDEGYRNAYAESFMNSYVAAQIKILREQSQLTQQQLAEMIGTKQAGISRLENVNYSGWKVETLRRIARALKVRLKITFEEFGTLPKEIEGFRREALLRASFDKDPVFSPAHVVLGSAKEAQEALGKVPGQHRPPGSIAGDLEEVEPRIVFAVQRQKYLQQGALAQSA